MGASLIRGEPAPRTGFRACDGSRRRTEPLHKARPRHRTNPHRRDERGQAAGIETIPFGILVFIAGTILAINVWAVVDTRMAVDAAAHAYLRSYTAASSRDVARLAGDAAARHSLEARGITGTATISAPTQVFAPCRVAEVTISVQVVAIRAPFLEGIGTTSVRAREAELIEPFSAAGGSDTALGIVGTPCE